MRLVIWLGIRHKRILLDEDSRDGLRMALVFALLMRVIVISERTVLVGIYQHDGYVYWKKPNTIKIIFYGTVSNDIGFVLQTRGISLTFRGWKKRIDHHHTQI